MDDNKREAKMNKRQEIFKKLFNESYKKLFTVAFGVTKNRESAEDVLQESYIKAWNKFDDFDINKNFTNWMTTIVKNTAIDQIRIKRRSASSLSLDTSHTNQNKTVTWDIEDESQDIVKNYEKKELCEQIHVAISNLPVDLKNIMHLLTDNDAQYSYKEVSEILGEPVAAIRAKAHRARVMIQNQINSLNSAEKTTNL